MHNRRNVNKLLEILIFAICEYGIGAVTHLFLGFVLVFVCFFLAARKADLLHGEFDSADFQNVAVLYLVVLSKKATLDEIVMDMNPDNLPSSRYCASSCAQPDT